MKTTQPSLSLPDSTPEGFRLIVEEFQRELFRMGFDFALAGFAPKRVGENNGFTATYEHGDKSGTLVVTFSYFKESELQAAQEPELSVGNRYHPARLARRIGFPVPPAFDAAARGLQADYFRVATDEEHLPASVTDCRLLFVRGNWHPQVDNLTQGVIVDLKWTPSE